MTRIRAWLALSRPPFHTVGILPFVLGTLLAHRIEGMFDFQVFLLGTIGVVLIMLSTYYGGEYWDHLEDALSAKNKASRYAGGSGVVQKGVLTRQVGSGTAIRLQDRSLDLAVRRTGNRCRLFLFGAAATLGEHRTWRVVDRFLLRLAAAGRGFLSTDGPHRLADSLGRNPDRVHNIQCYLTQ